MFLEHNSTFSLNLLSVFLISCQWLSCVSSVIIIHLMQHSSSYSCSYCLFVFVGLKISSSLSCDDALVIILIFSSSLKLRHRFFSFFQTSSLISFLVLTQFLKFALVSMPALARQRLVGRIEKYNKRFKSTTAFFHKRHGITPSLPFSLSLPKLIC